MASSAVTNVEQYLEELPEDRRAVLAAMRKFIRRHLPRGYREVVHWGMICYIIPLEEYPHTYNGQPLGYLGLCAQKNYFALYMMGSYSDPAQAATLKSSFRAAGKKFDMGKSCLRFGSIDDLELEALGATIASTPPARFIELYEAGRAAAKTATRKPSVAKKAGTAAGPSKKASAKARPAAAKKTASRRTAAKHA